MIMTGVKKAWVKESMGSFSKIRRFERKRNSREKGKGRDSSIN